jgi:hypothetical protein
MYELQRNAIRLGGMDAILEMFLKGVEMDSGGENSGMREEGASKDIDFSTGKGSGRAEKVPGVRWKTVMLVVGSALVGATAVALWDRRVLRKIQSQAPVRKQEGDADADVRQAEEEIF